MQSAIRSLSDENTKLKIHITDDADKMASGVKSLLEASEIFRCNVWEFVVINYGKLVVIALVLFLGAYNVYSQNKLDSKLNMVVNGIYTEDNTYAGGNPSHSVLPYSRSYQWEMERREQEER